MSISRCYSSVFNPLSPTENKVKSTLKLQMIISLFGALFQGTNEYWQQAQISTLNMWCRAEMDIQNRSNPPLGHPSFTSSECSHLSTPPDFCRLQQNREFTHSVEQDFRCFLTYLTFPRNKKIRPFWKLVDSFTIEEGLATAFHSSWEHGKIIMSHGQMRLSWLTWQTGYNKSYFSQNLSQVFVHQLWIDRDFLPHTF